MQKIAYALAALVLAYAAFYVAADRWGRDRLDAYDMEWSARLPGERARAAAVIMPAIDGAGTTLENAAPLEAAIFERLQQMGDPEREALRRLALWKPGAPWPADADAIVTAGRGDVEEILRALARLRCDWEYAYDASDPPPRPLRIHGAQVAQNRLLVAGHERANAGDAAGAARLYVAGIRLGADLSQGPLVAHMVGNSGMRYALDALARLVARGGETPPRTPPAAGATREGAAGPQLAQVETVVPRLMAAVPTPAASMRREQLQMGAHLRSLRNDGARSVVGQILGVRGTAAVVGRLLPGRAMVAHAIGDIEGILEDVEAAAALPSRDARDDAFLAVEAGILASWNPVLRMVFMNFAKQCEAQYATQARAALLSLAIDLERRRASLQQGGAEGDSASAAAAAGGTVPAALPDGALAVDPCAAPALLRYAPSANGAGWRIWSAGANGRDEGGTGDDVVYERAARLAPAVADAVGATPASR